MFSVTALAVSPPEPKHHNKKLGTYKPTLLKTSQMSVKGFDAHVVIFQTL